MCYVADWNSCSFACVWIDYMAGEDLSSYSATNQNGYHCYFGCHFDSLSVVWNWCFRSRSCNSSEYVVRDVSASVAQMIEQPLRMGIVGGLIPLVGFVLCAGIAQFGRAVVL